MFFEDFERTIWEWGYGIVALNHFTKAGKRSTYCVVLSRDSMKAFKSEGSCSTEVFEDIRNQIGTFRSQALQEGK